MKKIGFVFAVLLLMSAGFRVLAQSDSPAIKEGNGKYVVAQMDSVTQDRVRFQTEYAEFVKSIRQESDAFYPKVVTTLTIDSLRVIDSYFVYFVSIMSQDLRDVGDRKQYVSKSIRLMKGAPLFSKLNRFQLGLSYHFTIADMDSSFTVNFSNEEIQAILENESLIDEPTALQTLSDMIRDDNRSFCPKQVDEVTVLDSICIRENNLVYSYTIYEKKKVLKFKDLKKNMERLKITVVYGLMTNEGGMTVVALCTQLKYGIQYLYVRKGHPRDWVSVLLSPEDVARIHQYHLTGE